MARHASTLAVYTDATSSAGAEAALRSLVVHLAPHLDIVVCGPDAGVIEPIAAARPGARSLLVPHLATRGDLANATRVRSALVATGASALLLNKTEVAGLRYVEAVARTIRGLRIASVVHDVADPGSRAARHLSKALARTGGPVIAVGDHVARQLEHILELAPGSVAVIPNALSPMQSVARRTGASFTVGTLARLVPHKRVDLLIRAVVELPGVHLVIGGDGPEEPALRRLCDELGVRDRVRFLGWVDPAVVLGGCDVFALASDREGWPMAVVEAHHRGVPVLATAVGSVPELIEHGSTGVLVAAGDLSAMVREIGALRDDPERARSMGERARAAIVSGWTPSAMARRYERELGIAASLEEIST